MGTHFYKFHISQLGNLIYWGKLDMKYYSFQTDGFDICFKDTEIESAKDSFLVGRFRTVKSGKSWLNNHLKK